MNDIHCWQWHSPNDSMQPWWHCHSGGMAIIMLLTCIFWGMVWWCLPANISHKIAFHNFSFAGWASQNLHHMHHHSCPLQLKSIIVPLSGSVATEWLVLHKQIKAKRTKIPWNTLKYSLWGVVSGDWWKEKYKERRQGWQESGADLIVAEFIECAFFVIILSNKNKGSVSLGKINENRILAETIEQELTEKYNFYIQQHQ